MTDIELNELIKSAIALSNATTINHMKEKKRHLVTGCADCPFLYTNSQSAHYTCFYPNKVKLMTKKEGLKNVDCPLTELTIRKK